MRSALFWAAALRRLGKHRSRKRRKTRPLNSPTGASVCASRRPGANVWACRATPVWDRVLQRLAPLPVEDGVYVLHEGVQDMWTKWNFEHPALTGVYGWLPGDGVDLRPCGHGGQSLHGVALRDLWGWDFPDARDVRRPARRAGEAVDFLLHPRPASPSATTASRRAARSPTSPATAACSTPSR